VLFVEFVEDQWYGPDASYFRVHADDGSAYVLAYFDSSDTWTLASLRPNDISSTIHSKI
jgi:hypothetical protein